MNQIKSQAELIVIIEEQKTLIKNLQKENEEYLKKIIEKSKQIMDLTTESYVFKEKIVISKGDK